MDLQLLLYSMVLLSLLHLGTLFPKFPVFSSFAPGIVVPRNYILVPLQIILIGYAFLTYQQSWLWILIAIVLLANICIHVYLSYRVRKAFEAYGASVSLLRCYQRHTFSNVKKIVQPYHKTTYGNLYLNIYQNENQNTLRPVIVYIHGGGWILGSKDNHEYDSKMYAKHGFVVVSVDYTLSNAKRHLYKETEKEIAVALNWVYEHIAQYGGNKECMYLIGDSAGGNLALEVAFREDLKIPNIKAISVLYPAIDLIHFYHNSDWLHSRIAKKMAFSYIGKTPQEDQEAYNLLNPCYKIRNSLPPINIIVGMRDTLVPPMPTYEFAKQLQDNHCEVQLVKVPYMAHILDHPHESYGHQGATQITIQWFQK